MSLAPELLCDAQARRVLPVTLGCHRLGTGLSPALEGGAVAVWVIAQDVGLWEQGVSADGPGHCGVMGRWMGWQQEKEEVRV